MNGPPQRGHFTPSDLPTSDPDVKNGVADPELEETLARIRGDADRPRYEGVRFVLLRALGFVYVFAFLGATQQLPALVGPDGLLPAALWVERTSGWDYPSLFRLVGTSDLALVIVAWLGVLLGLAVMLGVTNAFVMLALWILQLSVLHVGQVFYGYGWEILLAEAGWIAVLLCPWRS